MASHGHGNAPRPGAPALVAAALLVLAPAAAAGTPLQPLCTVARAVLNDEAGARRWAEQVARQCFGSTGSGGSALVYSRIELRPEPGPGPAATARWWVWIPEARSDIEPSGLYLTLDTSTGTWVRRRVE